LDRINIWTVEGFSGCLGAQISLLIASSKLQKGWSMPDYKPIGELSHNGKPLLQILDAHRKWLRGEGGERADLRRSNLIEADLSRVYLIGANLSSGAVIVGANLSEANLIGANLVGANLVGANMIGADLIAANMSGSLLREANLSQADLREANLSRAVLKDAVLKGANLTGVNLSGANLIGANLVGANLVGANLMDSDLSEANLVGAEMGEANLMGANLSGSNLSGANLREAALVGAEIKEALLIGADLHGANFREAKLFGANLRDSTLTASILARADLSRANLSGVVLDDAVLSGWIIVGVTCTHIISGREKTIRRFSPGEFEEAFAERERLSELILNIPFTISADFVARFITQSINDVVGWPVMSLKGIEALSKDDTKFTFFVLDKSFYEKQVNLFETQLRDALNEYFKTPTTEKYAARLEEITDETNKAISLRKIASTPYAPWQGNTKGIQYKVAEQYSKMEKMSEAIRKIVDEIFR
jgi:uncharacterized protein YjbI with pentapeptide repeats